MTSRSPSEMGCGLAALQVRGNFGHHVRVVYMLSHGADMTNALHVRVFHKYRSVSSMSGTDVSVCVQMLMTRHSLLS